MSCTICNHPNRQAIDQALVAGSATLAALGHQYNLSTSALHRHKAHLKVKVSRAQNQLQENLRQGCIFWLSQALEMAMQTAKAAQAEGNSRLVLQALAQGTRLVTIILKQDLNLDDRIIYEILANPQWATQATLLPADPNLMSLGRQSLAATLSSPCPETPADAPTSASPEELALMQQFLHILADPSASQPETADPKPLIANLNVKREKGGKKAGKNSPKGINNKEYQLDELENKIAQLDLAALTRGLSPRAANAKLEAIFEQLDNCGEIPKDKLLSEYIYEQSLKGNQEDTAPQTAI